MKYARKFKNGQVTKKKSKKKKIIILFSILIILVIAIIFYLNYVVNPLILQTTEAKIKSLSQKALSSAVYTIISTNDFYDNIISYTYDNAGKISMINAKTLEVNKLSRQISAMAQGSFDNMAGEGIEIHLGAFSGIMLLANTGPQITLRLSPIGTVSTAFRSEFVSAGINQTNHRIFIQVSGFVSVILPMASPQIETTTEVLIAESLIVGEIPSTYLQSSYLDEMLNLVPA